MFAIMVDEVSREYYGLCIQGRTASHAQDDEENAKLTHFENNKRFVVPVVPLAHRYRAPLID